MITPPASPSRVMQCVLAMQSAVQAVPSLQDKLVFVYSEDDLMDKIKGLKKFPGVGVVYEGMHSLPEEGSTAKTGISSEIVISLIIISQGDAIVSTDSSKITAIDCLDDIRNTLMGTRSPTGHYWHFLVEAPAEVKKGMVFWVQRWSAPIQLPPRR